VRIICKKKKKSSNSEKDSQQHGLSAIELNTGESIAVVLFT